MDRPHWSYSQIAQFLRCPLQYYFRRVLGLKEETISHQLALGSSVHEALAHYHHSLQHGMATNHNDVREKFRNAWKQRKERDRIDIPVEKPEEEILQQGETLLQTYLEQSPPKNIVGVEQTMLVPVANSQGEVLEKPLVAIADLITRDEFGIRIHDFKTSGRTYSDFEASTSLQATCYLAAANTTFGNVTRFRYTVLVKTKKPKVQHLDSVRDEKDYGRLGDLIEMVDRAVTQGIFYPIESPLNCSGCSYRRPCLDWSMTNTSEDLIQLRLPGEAMSCSSNSTRKAGAFASQPEKANSDVRFLSDRQAKT